MKEIQIVSVIFSMKGGSQFRFPEVSSLGIYALHKEAPRGDILKAINHATRKWEDVSCCVVCYSHTDEVGNQRIVETRFDVLDNLIHELS